MKKFFVFLVILVALILTLLGVGYFIFQNHLKSNILPEIKKIIKEQTKLDIDFSEVRFSFKKLLQFEPSIQVRDLRVEDGLFAKKIYAELYIKPLLKKRFEVKELLVENANIKLVENKNKIVSIKGIDMETIIKETELKKKTDKEKRDRGEKVEEALVTDLVLKKVKVKNSSLEYLAYGQTQPIRLSSISMDLKDFEYNADGIVSKFEFDSRLFDNKNSKLYLKGDLGPFPEDFTSLPIKASQSLKLIVSDIPEKILKDNFGDMLKLRSNPEIEETAWLSGNVFGNLAGDGKIKLKSFEIGASDEHTLTANSELPVKFKLRMNTNPNLKLEIKGASLDLKDKESNKGQMTADNYIDIDINTGTVQGSSSGSISGLELEEALSTFVNAEDIISGEFELKDYQIFFKGKNADEFGKSLKGNGKITIHNGSLYILKSITKYKDIAKSLVSNGDEITEKLAGNFLELTSDVKIEKRNLYTNNISLAASDTISILGSGVLKKGTYLVYDVDLKLPKLAAIPINIRGTLEKPSVYPDVKNMGAKQGQEVLNQTLQYGLNILNQALSGKQQPQTTSNGDTTISTNGESANIAPSTSQKTITKPTSKDIERAAKSILFNVLDNLKEQQTQTAPTANTNNGI